MTPPPLLPLITVAVVVISAGMAPPAAAQLSLPGVAHLDARSVVVSVFPDSLEGVHFHARILHKRKWVEYTARFDPDAMVRWVGRVKAFVGSTGSDTSQVSPILPSLEGDEGLAVQRPGRKSRQLYWLLHRLEEGEPVVIRAEPDFTDTLLTSLSTAAHLSAIDSTAFATGLVAPLTDLPDSLCPWPISVPQPVYPSKLASAGMDGLVQVRYVIEADGTVNGETIEVLWASAPEFIPPVKAALTRGRFRPARPEGKAVRSRVYQTIRFGVHGQRPHWN